MAISLEGSDKAKRVLKTIAENIDGVSEETLKQIGDEAIKMARQKTPVKTGRLARGHGMKMTSKKDLLLSNEAEYAATIEFGSSTQPPQPHWRPALEVAKKELPKRYAKKITGLLK
jgi:HK97 gp10 family phage protein